MIRQIVITLTMLALSGCATYSDLRQRQADYSAETTKLPQTYVDCVLPQWMDTNSASHVVNNGEERTIVVPAGGAATSQVLMTLEVTPTPKGSHVEMKHMPSIGSFDRPWSQAQSCLW